jgi:hypothetical protein
VARILGSKVTIEMGSLATPEVFTKVANVKNIGGPGMSRDAIDTTSHGDDAKHKMADMIDAGEVPLEIQWDPAEATHDESTGLYGAFNDGLNRNFKIKFGTAATLSFAGFVSGFEFGAEAEGGLLTANVTITIDGLPTLATP